MRWNLIKITTIFFVSFCYTTIHATLQKDTISLNVAQLFERIDSQHLRLLADRIKEKIAAERTKTAESKRFPQIIIGMNDGYIGQPIVWQQVLSNPIYPKAPHWKQSYSIDIKQPIYEGGQIKYSIRKNRLEQEIEKLQRQNDEIDIKLSLLGQYLNLFSLYKQRIVLDRNIKESEQRLKDIKKLRKEGIITDNDVLRSKMQLTNSKLSMVTTENNIRIISQQLDILLGLDEHLLIVPDTALLNYNYSIENYDNYVHSAFTNNKTIRLLDKKSELAENNIRLSHSELLPKLYLTAFTSLARPLTRTMSDLYNYSWNIGVALSYPISSLYHNKNKIKEAQQNFMLVQNAKEQHKQNIRTEIKSAILKYQEATQRVEALKLSLKQAKENYRIMNNRYMNQLAILTDLLDADNLRLNAELQLTTARTQMIYTYYQLQRTIGNL